MVKIATLGKIALAGVFPICGMLYATQAKLASNVTLQPYYEEAISLTKGYKPLTDKLGEPLYFKKVDVSDKFNFADQQEAHFKIPVQGQKLSADVKIHASRNP